MRRGSVMASTQEPRESRESREPREPREPRMGNASEEISLPKQVWNKYRYLTIYAASISTLLLVIQLRGS